MGIRLNIIVSVILHAAAASIFFAAANTGGIQQPNRVITVNLIEEQSGIQKAASLKKGDSEAGNIIKRAEARPVLNKATHEVSQGKENIIEQAERSLDSEPALLTSHVAARPAVFPAVHYKKTAQNINYAEGISRSSANSRHSDTDSSHVYENVRSAIEKMKKYPTIARKRGIEGTVYVGFRINSLGEPEDLVIVKGSGSSILDNATIAIVKKAAPFPGVDSPVEIPVVFRLTD